MYHVKLYGDKSRISHTVLTLPSIRVKVICRNIATTFNLPTGVAEILKMKTRSSAIAKRAHN